MSAEVMQKPLCESRTQNASNGCCANGRNCDKVCIAVVAAEECRRSMHDGSCDDAGSQEEHTRELDMVGADIRDSELCLKKCCGTDQGLRNARESTKSVRATATDCCGVVPGNRLPDYMPESFCMDKLGVKQDSLTASGAKNAGNTESKGCCTTVLKDDSENRSEARQSSSEVALDTTAAHQSTPVTACVSEPTKESCCVRNKERSIEAGETSDSSTRTTEFREACETHLEKAMKKYTAYLEAGTCICRQAMKSIDVCCSQNKRAAVIGKRKAPQDYTRSCCTKMQGLAKKCKLKVPSSPAKRSRDSVSCHRTLVVDTCCDEKVCDPEKKSCAPKSEKKTDPDYCGKTCAASCEKIPQSGDLQDCCSQKVDKPTTCILNTKSLQHTDISDPERDAAREHVSFSVVGMTCTGCTKKVVGSLDQFNGVQNVKVNFVTATAGMDIDGSKTTAQLVLERLEHETGFRCSRIITGLQSLRIIMTDTQAQELRDSKPIGIETIKKAGKNHWIEYDPTVVGAREVLRKSQGSLAPPEDDSALAKGHQAFISETWSFIAAAALTIPVVVLAWADTDVSFLAKSLTSIILGTLVQVIAIPKFYMPALKALIFSKTIEMDMLVVISITAAYCYSVVAFGLQYAGVAIQQGEIFETSTLLITLILLGRLVSAYSKIRAVQAVSLRSLQAGIAHLEDSRDNARQIDARLLEYNDIVLIQPHSKIVSDGEIVEGHSDVDESMLTGESIPIEKTVGMKVVAGTLNGSGLLRIRITRLPGQNSITDIANLVRDALVAKPRIQNLADVVAGYFVPFVMAIAILTFAIWIVIVLRVRKQSPGEAIGIAITYAIAVLAISCPCALGLAVPLCLVIAGGVAARNGVIIKQGDVTERAFKVTDVVFDKTGTLTSGKLSVVRQVEHENNKLHRSALDLAYALVKDNQHPVSQSVAAFLKDRDVTPVAIDSVQSVPGSGIQAVSQGAVIKAGNPYWLDTVTEPATIALQAEGFTVLTVTIDDVPVVSFGLTADLRPEALSVVRSLYARGISCHIVSGDSLHAVENIANILDIDPNQAVSRQSPADRQAYVRNLSIAGRTTLFIGDGTNDAVAVAQANVGVQIGGSASDITRATADVVLLGGLDGLLTLFEVSRQTYYRIIFNFAWAFIYNLFAILLAAGAFVKIRIPPSFAGLGEIVSVLPVVLAAMTLLRANPKRI